jgi:HK97 family phage major capsid protein
LARIESDPVASWRPENVSLNDTTINFAAIHLKPKTVGALIKLPIELAEDASNLEPIVSAALTAALGNELDRALLFGDGATEVKGLKSYIGDADQPVGTQDPTGPLTDYDDFSLAQQAIKQANFKANAVIMSPRSAGQLDRAKTGITNDLTPLTPPQSWAELTKFVTSQVLDTFSGTESDAFVGQFNQLLVGMRSQIIVEANRQAGDSFSKLQVFIRAYMRVDAALARAGAFQIVTGIEA